MILREEVRDILDVPKKYYICHASSAELNFDTGLASVINTAYDTKESIRAKYGLGFTSQGRAYLTGNIITLTVKKLDTDRPQLSTVEECLLIVKNLINLEGIRHIAFPTICCGNMGMNWSDIKKLIIKTFSDCDVEILICHENDKYLAPNKEKFVDLFNEYFDDIPDDKKKELYTSLEQEMILLAEEKKDTDSE